MWDAGGEVVLLEKCGYIKTVFSLEFCCDAKSSLTIKFIGC